MAWGEAFKMAKEAYDQVVQLSSTLEYITQDVKAFETRLTAHIAEFKREVEQRLHNHFEAQRSEARELERRLREQEESRARTLRDVQSELLSLRAEMRGILATAASVALKDQERSRAGTANLLGSDLLDGGAKPEL